MVISHDLCSHFLPLLHTSWLVLLACVCGSHWFAGQVACSTCNLNPHLKLHTHARAHTHMHLWTRVSTLNASTLTPTLTTTPATKSAQVFIFTVWSSLACGDVVPVLWRVACQVWGYFWSLFACTLLAQCTCHLWIVHPRENVSQTAPAIGHGNCRRFRRNNPSMPFLLYTWRQLLETKTTWEVGQWV